MYFFYRLCYTYAMFKKRRDIQSILTIYFTLITALLLGALSIIFSLIQYRSLRANALEDLRHGCNSIGENIDLQIGQLDTICLNSINSSDLKTTFEEYTEKDDEPYTKNRLKRHLTEVLMELKGFDYSIRQLNIYDMGGEGYGVGNHNGALSEADNDPRFLRAYAANGRMYINTSPAASFKSEHSLSAENEKYFSIYRTYFNSYHTPLGYICARKYYDIVFRSALKPSLSYSPEIIIYNAAGEVIFPYEGSANASFPYLDYRDREGTAIYNDVSGRREYCCYYDFKNCDFTIVLAVGDSEFLSPVYRSLTWTFILFALVFGLSLALIAYLSRKLSTPIRQIYHFLAETEAGSSVEIELEDTGIREIDKLKASLNENIRARDAAVKQMMVLNEQEVQAQMLALQSQMNPHFLYNSLSSIAEMANEGHTDQVEKMVYNISQILRYISSNRNQLTSIEEELELTDMYLECMSLRFGEALEYSFEVEDDLLDYQIPKLCIQLLVENAIKSVTAGAPPWRLAVRGYSENGSFYIRVEDNGSGFDPDVDKKLRNQMDEILKTGTLPSLKIEGMGILNIFIRLYLLDGITFIFDFGNREDGGAFVTIGRHINDKT